MGVHAIICRWCNPGSPSYVISKAHFANSAFLNQQYLENHVAHKPLSRSYLKPSQIASQCLPAFFIWVSLIWRIPGPISTLFHCLVRSYPLNGITCCKLWAKILLESKAYEKAAIAQAARAHGQTARSRSLSKWLQPWDSAELEAATPEWEHGPTGDFGSLFKSWRTSALWPPLEEISVTSDK